MPKKLLIVSLICSLSLQIFAQQKDYQSEIGILGGAAYYLGDATHKPFQNLTPTFGALYRYRFDSRYALRTELTGTLVKGGGDAIAAFENPVAALDVCGEFNFFDLEKNTHKRFSKIFSPYIFAGFGAMIYSYDDDVAMGVSLPIGIGFKVKLGGRWNLNLQHTTRLLFADNLEGVPALNDPYRLNGGDFMNNDLLSGLTVGVTFDLWQRRCKCLNEHAGDQKKKR